MTSVDLKSLETFILWLLACCAMAGFFGVYVAFGVKRFVGWVTSLVAFRRWQVRTEQRVRKLGEQ
jgi:hypothetical protein